MLIESNAPNEQKYIFLNQFIFYCTHNSKLCQAKIQKNFKKELLLSYITSYLSKNSILFVDFDYLLKKYFKFGNDLDIHLKTR